MNEGTRSGKSTIRLLGVSAERPTNGLYLLPCNRTYFFRLMILNDLHGFPFLFQTASFIVLNPSKTLDFKSQKLSTMDRFLIYSNLKYIHDIQCKEAGIEG
jgi:hypothetical protein